MTFQNGLPRGFGLAAAALGALMLATPSMLPARADGLPNPLANFMQPGSDNNGPIDYTPRPALVVPPTNDLPPPQSSSDVPGANWPKAPDTKVLNAAKADSRRPAPSEDSQGAAGVAPQAIYVQAEECNKILGMCFNTPGATDPKKVVLAAPQRRYLIDPPASYMAAVPMQPGDANAAAPEPSCAMPGWFGCPERPENYWHVGLGAAPGYYGTAGQPGANGTAGQPGANGAAGQPNGTSGQQPAAYYGAAGQSDAPPGQIFGQQPPPPQKKCPLGAGWFGCQEEPQTYSQPQPPGSQAQAQSGTTMQSSFEDQQTGPVPPGQVFGQPRAPLQQHCMLNGWFGCQEQ